MPKKKTAYERMLEWLRPGPKPTTTTTTTPAPTPTTTTTAIPGATTTTPPWPSESLEVPPGLRIALWAKAQVGKPYATYRDCSGFTAAAYRQIGITIPEGSVAQWGVGLNATGPWQPGDLIFWDTFGPAPGHVALYVGNNKVIHALNEQRGIVESDVNANMGGPLMGGRRILQSESPVVNGTVSSRNSFRDLPRLTENQVCAILAGTPMAAECSAIWRATKGDPLPLAQSWPESNYGKSENAQETHNPLGLLQNPESDGPYLEVEANGVTIKLLKFKFYSAAFSEWRRRMDNPSYRGGVYPQGMTLGEYIRTYVAGPGPGYANNESPTSVANYLDATVARINRYLALNPESPKPPAESTTPGTTPPPTPQPTGTITFGRVPPPEKYAEKFIAPDGVNTAFNWVNKRIPRGLTLHRMIGTLIGTDNYFRNEARESALTDFGVGNGGNAYRWTKPGASISPWASGATGVAHAVPSGDGVDFVNRYGWRQNSDTESIEIEGLKYSDPVPAADYQALVRLVAWRVDSWLKIPWNQWPKNHDGAQAIYWHNEFQDEKPCPGQVVMDFTDRLIEDVRVRLRQYQEG